jgi:ketosteroid isomerase-like protein
MTKAETIIRDIYDAWRAHDLEWLASYLPEDFSHMVYVPKEIHPLGGLRHGKAAALQRWTQVSQEFDLLRNLRRSRGRGARRSRCVRTQARWRLEGERRLPKLVFWRETKDCEGKTGWVVVVGTR